MAFPFTPHTTFSPNTTPVIPADYLNQSQEMFAAFAAHMGFGIQKLSAHSYDGATINVETLHGAIVRDYALGIYTAPVLPTSPTSVTVANLVPTAASFAASTWYYVYLRSNGRVAEFVLSATVPGSDLRWKGTDDTYRFLFSFRTTTTQTIDPFTHRDGVTEYIGGNSSSDRFEFGFFDGGYTARTLTFCPPHARRVFLSIQIINVSATAMAYVHVLPKGVPALVTTGGLLFSGQPGFTIARGWTETDSTPAIEAKLSTGEPSSTASICIAGWNEFR